MPKLATVYFNELEYCEDAVFEFPGGIPGFESQTEFLFIEQPHTHPLVYMQSLKNSGLCFLALPVFTVDPGYRLALSADEASALGLTPGETPEIGKQIGCMVLITLCENADPTVNLMSPVVLNLKTRKGIQAIQAASEYSLRHPLSLEKEAVSCS
jgi:flagellar assembly factor FliW